MQCDAEQAALRRVVDAEVEHRRMHGAIDDALDLPGVFLDHKHVVRTEKRDADRRDQPADFSANCKVRHQG